MQSSQTAKLIQCGNTAAFPRASTMDLVKSALQAEANSLQTLIENIPQNTFDLVNVLVKTTGSVIFTGAGKSGLIGRKLSATFASLGIPSFFLHPSDALHGDIGMVKPNDVVLALSKSGTGNELELILLLLKQRIIQTVLLCCAPGTLAHYADLVIELPLDREACVLNLAPTSSSTLMAAYGDALAIAVSSCKGFTAQDFARNHPAGALGKTLLLEVSALMHTGKQLPLLDPTTPFETVLAIMIEKKLGVGIVVNEQNTLLGIITDGDLRRACAQGPTIFSSVAQDIMTRNPKTTAPCVKASHALAIMEDFSITSLVVLENTNVVGLAHLHDLIKAGIRKEL